MTIAEGDELPRATLIEMGENGPQEVDLASRVQDKTVVIFAVPGAFTPTCHSAHVPSFTRTKTGFDAAGVDEVICVSVNDPFVMKAFGEATGATEAGITMLSDPKGDFARAMGLTFSVEAIGLYDRSQRYAMVVKGGRVTILHVETGRGTCEVSGGEALLKAVTAQAA